MKKSVTKENRRGTRVLYIATSTKGYDGYNGELRAPVEEGELLGKIIRKADPVSGGYVLNYVMQGGKKYEVGSTNPSSNFGTLLLLIFTCGGGTYLRYRDRMLVTDSAYGFLDGMCFLSL